MTALCKVLVVSCVLALSASTVYGQQNRCNGGVECILLTECTSLYNQLQANPHNEVLKGFLKGLHCGFEGSNPKFVNMDLESRMKSARDVHQPRQAQKNKTRKSTHPVMQPNIFDLAFWGITTVKPKRILNHHETLKPKRTPISKYITQSATVKPRISPTVKSTLKTTKTANPIMNHVVHPIRKPPSKPTIRPAIHPLTKPNTVKPITGPKVQSTATVKQTMKPIIQPSKKPLVQPLMKPATVKPLIRPTTQPAIKTGGASTKPLMKHTVRPIMKPTSKPIALSTMKHTVKPMVTSGVQPTIKPVKATVKPLIKLTSKPPLKLTTKRTVQTSLNSKIPDRRKICCPPFQFDPNSSSASSWSGNTNGGGDSWNRGGPSTNSNPANGWSGGNNNGGNTNGANNLTPNPNAGGTGPSNPTDLLPNTRICGIQNNDRIVGGTRADIDEHPWMALLRYDKPVGWGFYCGGVLISSRYVLTAAHCVKGQDLPTNWRLSQVRLGEWNTSSVRDCVMDDCAVAVQDVAVEATMAHEQYDPLDANQHNDIALLRLATPVQFNDFVKPICLPITRDMKNSGFDGFNMEVAGWGKTESRSESDVKLKVSVPVVSKSQCESVFNKVGRQIINKQLCAGGTPGRDSCRGDSGGALMGRVPTAVNWYAIGVVSYGPSPCGTPGWPGVYTRVGAYVDWILSKLRA